ncbi:MAG TPA: N-acetyltransferase [Bacillus sp. (in: firmicutes)]|uniref:N-acetyltransferase n=1 Tax=Bacillus litorisediminis TaxID=2922713 RepID=UPI001FABC74E|nr:N-acetyltransferase [Bacillus litorisediminis]HWO75887.1 N-acetyltransferase [Bacillus sp. (in: firmicutes)]
MDKKCTVVTLKERPDLKDELNKLHSIGWVSYMGEDPIAVKYWNRLLSCFPEYQFILLNEESKPIACGNSIPFDWDGNKDSLPTGWDGVFEKGILDYENNVQSNSLSALAIVIHPEFRGKGISDRMVREMKSLAIKGNLKNMIAPVRPSLKSKYPLIPMEEYISWIRDDGTPFDPWIRTHYKIGASIIKVAEKSMIIPASVKEWEDWTGLKLPSSGSYVIPGGLVPLEVDNSANMGVYIEPNVWMKHYLD